MTLFVHEVQGHPKGLVWRITDGVSTRYEFTTNWPHIFPYIIEDYRIDTIEERTQHLKTLLEHTGEQFSLDPEIPRPSGGKGTIHVHMERDSFERAKKHLEEIKTSSEKQETEKDKFQTAFSDLARWEIRRYQKLSLDDTVTAILEQQESLNKEFQQLHSTMMTLRENVLRAEEHQAMEAYEHSGIQGVIELFKQTYETGKRSTLITSQRQETMMRLEQLAEMNTKTMRLFERSEVKRIAVGVMSKSAYAAIENSSAKLARKLITKPQEAPDNYTQELAASIAEHQASLNEAAATLHGRVEYDKAKLKFRTHLPLLEREQGRLRINGIQLHSEQGKPMLMSAEEFLTLPKSYFDIEKPQFDTPLEEISWCATLVEKNTDSRARIMDTLRAVPADEIDGYTVIHHRFEHELVRNIARHVQDSYLHFIYNAVYEASQTREEGSFTVGGKKPRKKATADQKAGPTKDFMGRWTMSDFADIVDWMKFSRISKPHRPTHRLEAYMNHQARRAGLRSVFEKGSDYDELRTEDQWAAILGLPEFADNKHKAFAHEQALNIAKYTASDVEVMFQNMHYTPTINEFHDVIDIAHTFGISISQVTSNANTTRQDHDRVFFNRHRYHNDEGFFRELHRKEIQTFKQKYTRLKIKTFSESGLDFSFQKGLIEGVDQYYFCPELHVMDLLRHSYPHVAQFVDRTRDIQDPERIVGRLQYLRAFTIPILADHHTIRRQAKERIPEAIDRLEQKAMRVQSTRPDWIIRQEGLFVHQSTSDNKLLEAIRPLQLHYEQKQGVRTQFPELIAAANHFARAYEASGFPHTKGIKGFAQRILSWRNRTTFYEKLYGITPQQLEDRLLDTFSSATQCIKDATAQVVQAEGKFLYIKGEVDHVLAREAGLFKVQEGLTVLSMSAGEFTYKNDGFYKGMTSRRAQASAYSTLFEVHTHMSMLDKIFNYDVKGALEIFAQAALQTNRLEERATKEQKEDLLKRVRSRGVYKGYVIGEEDAVEFSEQEKADFEPDYNRYQEEFYTKLFGLGKRGVSPKAKLASIIHAIIPLDEKKRRTGRGLADRTNEELYTDIITSNSSEDQEELIKELAKDYRRRDVDIQGRLF